jgi:putative ABC transport system permease protein
LLSRLAAVPGVESITGIRNPMMVGALTVGTTNIMGTTMTYHSADVGPDFFETLRIPLVRGRTFTLADAARTGLEPRVVSETYARQFYPGEEVVGKLIDEGKSQIIGIVKDVRLSAIRRDVAPMLYRFALTTEPDRVSALIIRTSGDPASVAPAIRQAVMNVNSRLLMSTVTIQDQMEKSIAQERLVAAASGLFSVLGLILAGIGLFGVAAFTVAQRTSELGIRIALGARNWDVIRESLRDTAIVFMVGLAAGTIAAAIAARVAATQIADLLFGISATEWTNVAAAALVMFAVAVGACALPALRAARVDPLVAIRYE